MQYRILEKVNSPADLKDKSIRELEELCAEIRMFLIETISKTGGHLASNLGAVELTVAIHQVFDSPRDKLVFDVGHQCYTHKLLTGRKEQFSSLRKKGGISGFPKPRESPHDAFVAGHASTSISAAYGIAKAMQMQGQESFAIALIGDGAMTGGEAYEAINNAGREKTRLIVILNHNDMSISKNVGSFARYLSSMRSKPAYLRMKKDLDFILSHTPLVGKRMKSWLERSKTLIKTALYPNTFFEEMGFYYLGPVDGHNLSELIRALRRAKELEGPVIIQVETLKGKGYPFAEQNPGAYHAIAGFDILNGGDDVSMADCYSNQAGMALTKLADENEKICAITAAMKYGTGLQIFCSAHKDRFFDVGIAEEHAVTFAGGLAAQGMLPVFCVYSSFLQRAYDQVIHDLAIEGRHVILCVDRAGIVGEDGETHQGIFDAAFLSGIPGITMYSPEGYEELEICIRKAVLNDEGVVAVRYPRGRDLKAHTLAPSDNFVFDQKGEKLLLISYGRIFSNCFQAACSFAHEVSLLKLTRISPIDPETIQIAFGFDRILFVEEGIRKGSVGEQFLDLLMQKSWKGSFQLTAIDNQFVQQNDALSALKELHMDPESIEEMIRQEM